MPKGKWISYSTEERAFIQSVSRWLRDEAHAAFCQKFGRDDVALSAFNGFCKRNGWMTGRTGTFSKGVVPHNKGKPCEPGKGGNHPNARRTQFAKGVRQGIAISLYQPIGTEKVRGGYLCRKVNDDLPAQRRWRAVHIINWEAVHGPVPKGHALKCLGDKANVEPNNWECVPRALLPRLVGGNRYRDLVAYDSAPAELKPTILAVAKLEHRARSITPRITPVRYKEW